MAVILFLEEDNWTRVRFPPTPQGENMFDDKEEINKLVNYLIDNGAIEIYGMTENAEITYRFNMKVLEDIMPEFYNMIMEEIDNDLLELYKRGLVDISYDENLEASFQINEEGKKFMKEKGIFMDGEIDEF